MITTPIADAEHAERIAAVRDALAEADLDVLLAYGAHREYHPGDLRYLARWYCIEEETACLVVPRDGATTLITDAGWDVDRARDEAFADTVVHGPNLGTAIATAVASSAGATARIGIAGWSIFPAPVYLELTRELPDAHVRDASHITVSLRMIKSAAELELLRAASRISDDAMLAGLREIKAGHTEQHAADAAHAVIRAAGAEPSFVIELGSGPRTALGTFLPGARVFEEGTLAVLDCGARVHGYHGDMARTVPVGQADAEQRDMLEAVERSVSDAIAAVRPGVTIAAVRDAAERSICESGYGQYWWDAFMPHGNGVAQHEPPDARNNPELPLQPGMVLCIEPGITTPQHGAVIIEQMITVTPDGAEVFNKLPTNMWQNGR